MAGPTPRSERDSEAPKEASFALRGGDAGRRLDRFLAEALGLSRARVRDLLARGGVSLDGRTLGYADKGLSLPGAGRLAVARFRKPHEQRARPGDGVPLLAEGPGWLAVDKPAGMPVHPLAEDETGSVLNALVARHPEIHGLGEGGLRSGVLHRLDVDTSGVLLFAREEAAWQRLRAAFREHRVVKRYRAIVAGDFPAALAGPASFRLAVARHRPARVRVVDDAWRAPGRCYPVRQEVTVLQRLADATLLEVRLETGFLHQIRVLLAHLGHPVLGDALYGEGAVVDRAPRQMLHAASLRFEEVAADSPDPEDFAAVLRELAREEKDA